jgi:DNA-directed RNA polymerase subunit RPC12/RpoP
LLAVVNGSIALSMTKPPPVLIAPQPALGMPEAYPLVHCWPLAPKVRLVGDFLLYDRLPRDPTKLRFPERPTSRLLSEFVSLADASGEAIEAYAKRWGVLGLCRHGFPTALAYGFHLVDLDEPGHTQFSRWVMHRALGGTEFFPGSMPEISLAPGQWACRETRREPLERWRTLAEVFRAYLENIERSRVNPRNARFEAAHVNHFAASFGHLRPVIVRSGTGFTLRLAGSLAVAGLAAALAYQLMIAVTGGSGWLICAECGKWFGPGQRRSPDRAAYCPDCGRAAAVRAASRRFRKKQKEREDLKRAHNGKETKRG